MTLIVGIKTKESIRFLADRCLSAPGRHPTEDAIKIMILETTDGAALLGLGARPSGSPLHRIDVSLRRRCVACDQGAHAGG